MKLRVQLAFLPGTCTVIVLKVVHDHFLWYFPEHVDEYVEGTAIHHTLELPANLEPAVHAAECIGPFLRV